MQHLARFLVPPPPAMEDCTASVTRSTENAPPRPTVAASMHPPENLPERTSWRTRPSMPPPPPGPGRACPAPSSAGTMCAVPGREGLAVQSSCSGGAEGWAMPSELKYTGESPCWAWAWGAGRGYMPSGGLHMYLPMMWAHAGSGERASIILPSEVILLTAEAQMRSRTVATATASRLLSAWPPASGVPRQSDASGESSIGRIAARDPDASPCSAIS